MKGTNRLVLNQATICDAIQYWLENEMLAGDVNIRVTNVNYNSSDFTFDVTVVEQDSK